MSLVLLPSVGVYLIPTIVAAYRDHREKGPILLVNLFLGWTVIGWIAALLWAIDGEREAQRVEAAGDEVGPRGVKLQGGDPRHDRP